MLHTMSCFATQIQQCIAKPGFFGATCDAILGKLCPALIAWVRDTRLVYFCMSFQYSLAAGLYYIRQCFATNPLISSQPIIIIIIALVQLINLPSPSSCVLSVLMRRRSP